MRRLLTFALAATFLLVASHSAMAVDKKKKKLPSKTVVKKTTKIAPAKPRAAKSKKVDTFVDRNKNGIDDRRENLKSKPAPKQKAPAKKTVVKKSVKKDTTKAPVKKKK